jgi:signal transduction histidine kinase/CheY-like chemotaxis protein
VIGLTAYDLDPEGKRIPELLQVMETGEIQRRAELPVAFDWSGTGIVETRHFNVTRAPLRDATGAIDGFVTWGLDVTEQVHARRRIEEAKLQAELANRAKDEFLAMLGHELRNPLAPITTALELMALRAPHQFERERAVIERQVQHVTRLVDDLLDVSRITRGGVELHREVVDLADIIEKAVEQTSPLLEEKKHTLVMTVPRGVTINGDPVRLAQIVSNLVSNAAKYTKAGGTITVELARDGGDATIRVKDTGIGIATEVLPKVFDTFYQVRQSIDRARGGLGLGLAIVRSLVRAHGGEATATSRGIGAGSEFVIRLPALDGEAPRATGTPVSGSHPLRPETLLLVDDNEDAIGLLADALTLRGFHAVVAHDAPSALALAETAKPHIALLDIGLPVMDGYELARRLRELYTQVQLVAITGYGQPTDIAKSKDAGFAAHLVKPFGIDEVLVVIDSLVVAARTSVLPTP